MDVFNERDSRQMSGDPIQGTEAQYSVRQLEDLLSGAESGLALFDRNRRLVYANPSYLTLCGYRVEDTRPGTKLEDLARESLKRSSEPTADIEETIRRGIQRLSTAGGYSFRFNAPSGMQIYVHRRMMDDGQIVETVRKAAAEEATGGIGDRLEMMAEAARMRMSHALEAMADGFALFDADDRLQIYNRQYIDLNPHIADVIAPGKKFEDMLRVGMERSGYEIGGVDVEHYIKWRVEQHQNPGEAHDLLMRDGRWVRVHEKRIADGSIVGIRSDITELKKRESELLKISNELRRSNMHFNTALNNMVQGLCMFDASQTLIVANDRYLELYGFSPDVVKPGIKLPDIMEYSVSIGNYTREDAERAKAERPDHAKKRQVSVLKQYLRDGRVIAVQHQPMPDGGSIATYEDVTELERSADHLREYTRKLEASNRELQDFAYVASHDLQEPLRKIETFGDRLKNKYADDLPDNANVYIERMQNATGRMRLLINDLLNYSRVTTKAKPFVELDMNSVVEGVLSDLQIRIEEVGATVEYEDLHVIEADATQMRQLIQNLIGNALKFQRPDVAPIVTVSTRLIEGDFMAGIPDMVELSIADNGIGFNNKYKDQIFTIFQRLHGRNEYEGTGIGLATCRKIVERHGGIIDANGIEGEGATFTATLLMKHNKNDECSEGEANHVA
jgi:signal transduction histidine kinase